MKKITMFVASLMLFVSVSLFAECSDGGKEKDCSGKMAKNLGLDAGQVAKVKAIHEKFKAQMKNATDKAAVKKEMIAAIESVLTADQKAKFEEM